MPENLHPRAEVIAKGFKLDTSCQLEKTEEPVTLVIFGATGDLTCRKLFPALFSLYQNSLLPEQFLIFGASRSKLSQEVFQERMKSCVVEQLSQGTRTWEEMAPRLFYQQVQFDSQDSFAELSRFAAELEGQFALKGNRLFYLAVPPNVYEEIARNLGLAGLAREEAGWSRFVVEKPFGRDLDSAKKLDKRSCWIASWGTRPCSGVRTGLNSAGVF